MQARLHTTRPVDLVAALAAGALAAAVVALDAPGILRVPVALLFVLFVPGYVFLAALYPERHRVTEKAVGEDEEATEEVRSGLEPLERIALSLGLSIAIVPLLGLALNYTPWGIRLVPIMATLAGFVVACAAAAWIRRRRLPEAQRFAVTMTLAWDWKEQGPLDRTLTVALALSVVVALGTLVYVLATPRDAEAFTEFYILGSDGKADCYPTTWGGAYRVADGCRGPAGQVTVGIVNHEQQQEKYHVRLVWSRETRLEDNTTRVEEVQVADAWDVTLEHVDVDLEPGSGFTPQHEQNVTLPPPPFDGEQRLSFQLFREAPPPAAADEAYMDSPHRRLHLWIER